MFRFRASPFIVGLESSAYQSLLTQLAASSLIGNEETLVRLPRPEKAQLKELIIAPILKKGWLDLGLLTKEGHFNLKASPSEVIKKFEAATGIKVFLEGHPFKIKWRASKHFVVGDFSLRSHTDYVGSLGVGILLVSELHDFLFHMPQLMDPDFRNFARLAARFDVIAGVTEARHSSLYLPFEGGDTTPNYDYLIGPVQITTDYLSGLRTNFPNKYDKPPLAKFAWQGDAQAYRLARGQRAFGFSRSFRSIRLDRDLLTTRYLSLVVMEHEMKYYIHHSRLSPDPDLLEEIEAERKRLETLLSANET